MQYKLVLPRKALAPFSFLLSFFFLVGGGGGWLVGGCLPHFNAYVSVGATEFLSTKTTGKSTRVDVSDV